MEGPRGAGTADRGPRSQGGALTTPEVGFTRHNASLHGRPKARGPWPCADQGPRQVLAAGRSRAIWGSLSTVWAREALSGQERVSQTWRRRRDLL